MAQSHVRIAYTFTSIVVPLSRFVFMVKDIQGRLYYPYGPEVGDVQKALLALHIVVVVRQSDLIRGRDAVRAASRVVNRVEVHGKGTLCARE